MYAIDPINNSIKALNRKKFSELGFSERAHLQEWIAGNPEALNEKLLIIQKEFDGFSDTYERLDLLALDKNGNLVIIENKLDDSGRDVTWQAIKYASYCSTLKKDDIREIFQRYLDLQEEGKSAIDLLEAFYDGVEYSELVLNQRMSQRIILISASFRMEVTSTVLWLMSFNLKLQCFKATPYEIDGQYFLTLDQIIPIKDAQDYMISMDSKAQEEANVNQTNKNRHKIRMKFWIEFLKSVKGRSQLFQNSNPVKENAMVAGGLDVTYVTYQLVLNSENSFVKINFGRSLQEENKIIFDALYQRKNEIEETFGDVLSWERSDENIRSSISFYGVGQNYFNEEEWPAIIEFFIININRLDKAVSPFIQVMKDALKGGNNENNDK